MGWINCQKGYRMDKIIIEGTMTEELISEDYDVLYDVLMQLGIENIKIQTESK